MDNRTSNSTFFGNVAVRRRRVLPLAIALALIAGLHFAAQLSAAAEPETLSIPYVPTRQDVVKDILWLAAVDKDDVVYDLGSGDGRVVIAAVRDFGARGAVGIEIDPAKVRESRAKATQADVAERVTFIEGDLFDQDVRDATVVVVYLGHVPNLRLRSRLFRELKPGGRVVSHQFGMGEWPPEKTLRVRTQYVGMYGVTGNPFADNPRVPDFGSNDEVWTSSMVRVWVVPAAVAGIWRGKVTLPGGDRELKLVLHQRIGGVGGSYRLDLPDRVANGQLMLALWGDHLRFHSFAEGRPLIDFRIMFDGQVAGDQIEGTLAIFREGDVQEYRWTGRREAVDLTGAWQWPSPTQPRDVQLAIERRAGRLVATYHDNGRTTAVEDFYDFGGGFYFTHCVGRDEDGSTVINPNTGWLIGQAIAEGDALTGTVEFHPYPGKIARDTPVRSGPREWLPKRTER